MFLIGLTGGIASGKSTVSNIFQKELNVPVVDADLVARKVVEPNTKGWQRVINLFGREILNTDNSINREKLGEIVFSDPFKRKQLNKCLHGLIILEMIKQIIWLFVTGHRYAILDVPLLFEVKMILKFLSFKLVVFCQDEQEQIRRLLKRNSNLSEADAKLRIDAQMSNKERIKLADFCIDNSKDLESTRKQVEKLNNIFKKSKKYLYIRTAFALFSGLFLTGIYFLFKFFI